MNRDIERAKNIWQQSYSIWYKKQNLATKLQLDSFYLLFSSTQQYINNLRRNLNAYNENNTVVVKEMLLRNLGDSLYMKLQSTFTTANKLARSDSNRKIIAGSYSSVFDKPNVESWKEEYFGQTSALGASIILLGFQTELYNVTEKTVLTP